MGNKLTLNPFEGSEEFSDKKPEDMNLDELKMLLHIKKLNLKLDIERLRTNINYTKIVIEAAKELGVIDKIESYLQKFLMPQTNQENKTNTTPS